MPASQPDRPVSADDLAVTLAVRQDLGPEHDEAVIAEFLDRVGPAIDARAAAVASSQQDARPVATVGDTGLRSTILAGASIVAGIPITAIALNSTEDAAGGLLALLVAWTGIAVVNIAHGCRR